MNGKFLAGKVQNRIPGSNQASSGDPNLRSWLASVRHGEIDEARSSRPRPARLRGRATHRVTPRAKASVHTRTIKRPRAPLLESHRERTSASALSHRGVVHGICVGSRLAYAKVVTISGVKRCTIESPRVIKDSRAKRVARGYGARIDGRIDDQQAVCPPVPLPEQEKEGESVSPSEAGVGGLKKVDSVETDMCKRFLGEGFMMNQRSCDSSACLICARPGNDAPLKRYVDDSDLRPSTSRDALSHIFRSLSPSQKEGERMVARMPALDSSTRGTKQGGRSVTELYASSSGGENDHNPGSPRGKLEFSDQLVPQSAVTERQECYRVRESDRDNRDKVIASMDFRSVGGFFASATSCKELCIHRLAQAEGDGESFVAHRQSVDPRWVHRTSAKLSSLAWNNNANVITVGDHYGELTRVDVETCHILTETDEGSGTAVLDLKRNRHFGTTCLLTATKSGAVKLWTEDLSESLELTDECVDRVPICGVAFSPVNPNWVAAARSDSVVTLYDIRHGAAPLWRRRMGGTNAVAHLDHLASGDLVCSQLNEGISVWRRSGQGEDGKIEMARRKHAYASHTQTKHFVGLSVSSRGFIATGSECGRAYVYGSRISEPVALCSSDPTLGDSGVTAVEWIPQDQCEGDSQGLLVAQGASINRFKIDIPAL